MFLEICTGEIRSDNIKKYMGHTNYLNNWKYGKYNISEWLSKFLTIIIYPFFFNMMEKTLKKCLLVEHLILYWCHCGNM